MASSRARARESVGMDVHDVLLSNELDGALRVARTRPVSFVLLLRNVVWGSCLRGTRPRRSARRHGCCKMCRQKRRWEGFGGK